MVDWTGVGPLTPTSYDSYDRYAVADLDDCKALCEIGVTGCRETCVKDTPAQLHLDVHDASAAATLSPCDALAFGILGAGHSVSRCCTTQCDTRC